MSWMPPHKPSGRLMPSELPHRLMSARWVTRGLRWRDCTHLGVVSTRLPGIQQHDLRVINQCGDSVPTDNAHCGPPHGADETVPGVLFLDVFGNSNAVGAESGPDEIEMLDGIRDNGGFPGNTEQKTTAACYGESRITLPTVFPGTIRVRG